jgi:hypothetical protein
MTFSWWWWQPQAWWGCSAHCCPHYEWKWPVPRWWQSKGSSHCRSLPRKSHGSPAWCWPHRGIPLELVGHYFVWHVRVLPCCRCAYKLGIDMGNPWVSLLIPWPIPTQTHTQRFRSGFTHIFTVGIPYTHTQLSMGMGFELLPFSYFLNAY